MPSKKKIKNIVFDFGGVLLDIDYERTYHAMSVLLGTRFSPDNLSLRQLKVMADFETGVMNTETFIWNIQQMAVHEVPQGLEIIKAWNAMLIGWNPEKFRFLDEIKLKYRIFLLSNTNELHMSWVYRDLKLNHQIQDFDTRYFEKTYYSHCIHLKKPDLQIYQYVTQDLNLDPKETLFIDDLRDNVAAAQTLGWNTYHHNPKDDIIDIFKNKLKLI